MHACVAGRCHLGMAPLRPARAKQLGYDGRYTLHHMHNLKSHSHTGCESQQASPSIWICVLHSNSTSLSSTFPLQISTGLGAGIPAQREKGEWIEGVAIWVAVFLVSGVGASCALDVLMFSWRCHAGHV